MPLWINSVNAEKVFLDDFSSDTSLWTYVGTAYRDEVNEYVVLTEDGINSAGGIIWFSKQTKCPFTIEFKFKIGGDGANADGMVFMFYKTRDYTPGVGGALMFSSAAIAAPGYGVAFDTWESNTVKLLKDLWSNVLIEVDSSYDDFAWHQVRIVVGLTKISVMLNGEQVFIWQGPIDRSHSNIGFGAATGGLNSWHIIDDVNIIFECPPVGGEIIQNKFAITYPVGLIFCILISITFIKHLKRVRFHARAQ